MYLRSVSRLHIGVCMYSWEGTIHNGATTVITFDQHRVVRWLNYLQAIGRMNDDRRRGRQLVVGAANDHETGPITVLVLWRCAAIETRLQYDAMHLPSSETGRKKKKKRKRRKQQNAGYSCVSGTLCLSAFTGERIVGNVHFWAESGLDRISGA